MMKYYSFLLVLIISFSISVNGQSYEEQYAKCSEPIRALGANVDSVYFVRVRERDSCLIGSVAPNFKAVSITGQSIELSKLKGQVVVLNFWFTRCQPCIQEMPALNKLAAHYAGKKVQFLSFAPENVETLQDFFGRHPFNFTAVANSEDIRRDIFKLFSAWPYAIIIDKGGKISKMWAGNPGENVFEHYKKAIDRSL